MTPPETWQHESNLSDSSVGYVDLPPASPQPLPTFICDSLSLVSRPKPRPKRMRLVFKSRLPRHLLPTVKAIAKLAELQLGWDSYEGLPISLRSIQTSIPWLINFIEESIPLPTVVPTASGGVQFEWHTGGIDLEITFSPDSRITAFVVDETANEEWERDISSDSGLVLSYLSRLAVHSR